MDYIGVVWIALILLFIIIESFTMQLISIWFTVGAFVAGIAYLLGANVGVQAALFFVVSILLMIVTRPMAKKLLKNSGAKTNKDRIINEIGIVTETIDNINAKGQIKVKNETWSARNLGNGIIEAGTEVTVISIEGVKAMVEVVKH